MWQPLIEDFQELSGSSRHLLIFEPLKLYLELIPEIKKNVWKHNDSNKTFKQILFYNKNIYTFKLL